MLEKGLDRVLIEFLRNHLAQNPKKSKTLRKSSPQKKSVPNLKIYHSGKKNYKTSYRLELLFPLTFVDHIVYIQNSDLYSEVSFGDRFEVIEWGDNFSFID